MRTIVRLECIAFMLWIITSFMSIILCVKLDNLKDKVIALEQIENAKTLREYEESVNEIKTLTNNDLKEQGIYENSDKNEKL